MSDACSPRIGIVEYFKELVDGALAHQRVAAGELTAFYVVQLLAGFLQRPADQATTMSRWRCSWPGARARRLRQRASLKQIGDVSLFISGFFSDSLRRKLVDVDYYVSIGGCAYHALSRSETDTFSPVFAELADKFVGFVDVLSEVSERTSCASNMDLLRLYERWLKTGSPRSGQLLVERGVVPNASLEGPADSITASGCSSAYRICDRRASQLTTLRQFPTHSVVSKADKYRRNGENRSPLVRRLS